MDILAGLDGMKSLNSRRAAVSIDAVLEDLQHSFAAKERKLEEEDEALMNSIVFDTTKDFVHRIEDEDSEDEDYLTQPSASNDESLNTLKKMKFLRNFWTSQWIP